MKKYLLQEIHNKLHLNDRCPKGSVPEGTEAQRGGRASEMQSIRHCFASNARSVLYPGDRRLFDKGKGSLMDKGQRSCKEGQKSVSSTCRIDEIRGGLWLLTSDHDGEKFI